MSPYCLTAVNALFVCFGLLLLLGGRGFLGKVGFFVVASVFCVFVSVPHAL